MNDVAGRHRDHLRPRCRRPAGPPRRSRAPRRPGCGRRAARPAPGNRSSRCALGSRRPASSMPPAASPPVDAGAELGEAAGAIKRFLSGAGNARSSSDVATGSPASSALSVTLRPTPITTKVLGAATSARMPASLPSPAITSLGHFRPARHAGRGRHCVDHRDPGGKRQPAPVVDRHVAGADPDRQRDLRPRGADQALPMRPRPAVWCSAINTTPPISSPAAARASRSELVDPVSSTTSRYATAAPDPRPPGAMMSACSRCRNLSRSMAGSLACTRPKCKSR